MKKIQQKEGWEKIQAGLKDGSLPHFNAAFHEKKEKEKK
jgi:hypothetical protein